MSKNREITPSYVPRKITGVYFNADLLAVANKCNCVVLKQLNSIQAEQTVY